MMGDDVNMVPADHEYLVPTKAIKSQNDMLIWTKSIAYQEIMGFIIAINEAVKGHSNKYNELVVSETIAKLCALLDNLDKLIDETPPTEQPQRFGNQAFREWLQKVDKSTYDNLSNILSKDLHRALAEITPYFLDSFGNATRIDYGTGHEIAFIMFLCALFKIGALNEGDKIYVATRVFNRYLQLVRKLQQVYRMEPAGSHGVWSLDDYQFVPFIWGSSQLTHHPKIEPYAFLKPEIVDGFADDFMFLSCIQYINSVKKGLFAEHSNQLWGISSVAQWGTVNSGLIKMYRVEVLGKFPVAQHILFGSLFPLELFTCAAPSDRGFLGMKKPPPEELPPRSLS